MADNATALALSFEKQFAKCIVTDNLHETRRLANLVVDSFGGKQSNRDNIINCKSPRAVYNELRRTLCRGNSVNTRRLSDLSYVSSPAEQRRANAINANHQQEKLTNDLLEM